MHGPMDYTKTSELRFRVRDLDLPEKKKHTSSREEEEDAQMMCPCGQTKEIELAMWEDVQCPRRSKMSWRRK